MIGKGYPCGLIKRPSYLVYYSCKFVRSGYCTLEDILGDSGEMVDIFGGNSFGHYEKKIIQVSV
jgi:hypothetical protein